jgi:uncharacterized protein
MDLFSVLLKPTRENFVASITNEEMNIVGQHFGYFKELLERKALLLAGRTSSGSFGLGIFQAEKIEDIRLLMEVDPCVVNGVFTYEVEEYGIALLDAEGLASYAT